MDQPRVEPFISGEPEAPGEITPSCRIGDERRPFFLSSIGISEPHRSFGVMMVGADEAGPAPDLERTLTRLIHAAKHEGADGLIHVGFSDHRSRQAKVARMDGGEESFAALAVLAWGTMIRLVPEAST